MSRFSVLRIDHYDPAAILVILLPVIGIICFFLLKTLKKIVSFEVVIEQ